MRAENRARRHDEVLRNAVLSHGGILFKHTGTGLRGQVQFADVGGGGGGGGAGNSSYRSGWESLQGRRSTRDGDYFGTVLNRAARLMAAGHGGQVLVADSTVRLLREVDLVDLGDHRMRDVPGPVGVFQVRAPGLAVDFHHCGR